MPHSISDRDKPLEEQVWDLRHQLKNQAQQIGTILLQNERYSDKIMELEKHIESQNKTIDGLRSDVALLISNNEKMLTALTGGGIEKTDGLITRIARIEQFVEMFKQKKTLITGYGFGISMTIGFLYALVKFAFWLLGKN